MKTGIIRMIQPTDKGGYQSAQGWIYTFLMTIQTNEGQVTGEIGSKTEQYPLGVGDEINFEMKNTEHGVKFKKVNPQFAQTGQGQAAGRPNAPQRNYDAENRGKCRTQFIKAAIIAGGLRCTCYDHVLELTEFAMTGIIPQESQSQAKTGDEIPF